MRVHVLQHVAFEGLGCLADLLAARQAQITRTRFFENPSLPAVDDFDALIAMGGPMSVNDEAELPWLVPEKALVRQAITQGKPVLGICLGAQLIASALGQRVYANRCKEIGWFPIQAVAGGDGFHFPTSSLAFHWHGETFDLPPQTRLLASSEGCTNQAFQLGTNVIGLQFHLEIQPAGVEALVQHCSQDIQSGPFTQSASQLLAAPTAYYQQANRLMNQILDFCLTAGARR